MVIIKKIPLRNENSSITDPITKMGVAHKNLGAIVTKIQVRNQRTLLDGAVCNTFSDLLLHSSVNDFH